MQRQITNRWKFAAVALSVSLVLALSLAAAMMVDG